MSQVSEPIRRECRERFPGLLDELPVEKYLALRRRTPLHRAYDHVPEAVRAYCRDLERRYSPAAVGLVHKLLLTHLLENPEDRPWPIQLTDDARALSESELTRIRLELGKNPPGYYEGFTDPFLKDLGICSGRLLHLGAQLVEVTSRLPFRLLLLRNPVDSLAALVRLSRGGGLRRRYFQLHTSERHLSEFNENDWLLLYDRITDLLKLNPRVGGVFSLSWYFDPALSSVSPRLTYLRVMPERGGAIVLFVSRDEESARLATMKSRTRQALAAAGRYRPAAYLLVWARNAMFRREADHGLQRLRRTVKLISLRALKSAGIFHLARWLSRRKLRILCYHGFSIDDLHEFDEMMFIRREVFERRMRLLKRWKLNPVSLRAAVEALPAGRHPDHGVVVTFDDGWQSISLALPILEELGIPATLYVATGYAESGASVFNVLVHYLLWKTKAASFEGLDLHRAEHRELAKRRILDRAASFDDSAKEALIDELARTLGVDLAPIEGRRLFHYFSIEELKRLPPLMDLQLHTHQHDLPQDPKGMKKEIDENRRALLKAGPGPFEHICYPSGIFSEGAFPSLEALGIRSGTTVENVLNSSDTPLLRLGRHVDRDRDSDLEFEAEITGTLPIVRALLGSD